MSKGRIQSLHIKRFFVLLPVLVSVSLLYLLVYAGDVKRMEFKIEHLWNGEVIAHDPVVVKISAQSKDEVKIHVQAPFFDDPGIPPCRSGQACPMLWDYEVVEVFFLGPEEKYLEVELCPHGQHLVLLLNGRRNMIKDKLDLKFTSTIDRSKKTWTGTALVPIEYFPPHVQSMNAYAIHGSGNSRQYEALYPATEEYDQPDFHRLEFFKDINFKSLFLSGWSQGVSDLWQ